MAPFRGGAKLAGRGPPGKGPDAPALPRWGLPFLIGRMVLFAALRRPGVRALTLAWFLSLAFGGGRLHECPAGHTHAEPPAPAAPSHHHGDHVPATAPPGAPCDCLGRCALPELPPLAAYVTVAVTAHERAYRAVPGDAPPARPASAGRRLPFAIPPPASLLG